MNKKNIWLLAAALSLVFAGAVTSDTVMAQLNLKDLEKAAKELDKAKPLIDAGAEAKRKPCKPPAPAHSDVGARLSCFWPSREPIPPGYRERRYTPGRR